MSKIACTPCIFFLSFFSLKLRYFTPCPGQKVDCCERDLKVDITRALRIKKNSNPDHLGGYEKQELQQTLSNQIFDFSQLYGIVWKLQVSLNMQVCCTCCNHAEELKN